MATSTIRTRAEWVRRHRLGLGLLGLVLAVALALVLRGIFFARPPVPAPPAPDLSGVDPAVRTLIEAERARVRQSPVSGAAWGRLGQALAAHQFANEARACFTQAERLEPDNPRWPYHQALLRLSSDPPEALPDLRRAVELAGDGPQGPRLRLAEWCLRLGHADEARAQFEALLRQHPGHARAHLGLARLHFQAGALAQAREHVQVALADRAVARSAWTLAAEVRERQGDRAAARQALARAASFPDDPEWPDEFFEEMAEFQVGESAQLGQAVRLLGQNRDPAAIRLLEDVVRDYPRSPRGWTLLGWALLRQRQIPRAERALQTALEIDPDWPETWRYQGIARYFQKDRPGAVRCYRRAIALKPTYTEAHLNLGLCLKEMGGRPAAIAAFRDALRCEPLSAQAHANLGELLLAEARQEARRHLEQAVDLDPADRNARRLLEETRRPPPERKEGKSKS